MEKATGLDLDGDGTVAGVPKPGKDTAVEESSSDDDDDDDSSEDPGKGNAASCTAKADSTSGKKEETRKR